MIKRRKGANHPNWQGGLLEVVCIECKLPFKVKKNEVKKGKGKFCSRPCVNLWQSKNKMGEKSSAWKDRVAKVKCFQCGGFFEIKKSVLEDGNGKFCSNKCYGDWRSKNITKDKVHTWKGGITPARSIIRKDRKYKAWRTGVFTRDNFTCQRCPTKGGTLHVHHLKRFSIILNDIRQKFPLLSIPDVAIQYPDLWDINNGITLCKKCHKDEHKRQNEENRRYVIWQ